LNDDGIITCPLATPYSIEIEEDSSSFTFILSDLRNDYNEHSRSSLEQTEQAIEWLAAFHATFYNHPILQPDTSTSTSASEVVWAEGGYWHLKTRLDELQDIPSSQRMFQKSAYAIDERMNNAGSSSWHTLVHGDFKEANILFGTEACAVVDFQYCGRGYGVKDLVMLIVSSVSSRVLGDLGEDGLLRVYCDALRKNLVAIGTCSQEDIDAIANFDGLKMQYELALVDYVRFMAGWGMWGSNSGYAEDRAVGVLRDVGSAWSGNNGKKSLQDLSEGDWKKAIYEKYPLGRRSFLLRVSSTVRTSTTFFGTTNMLLRKSIL